MFEITLTSGRDVYVDLFDIYRSPDPEGFGYPVLDIDGEVEYAAVTSVTSEELLSGRGIGAFFVYLDKYAQIVIHPYEETNYYFAIINQSLTINLHEIVSVEFVPEDYVHRRRQDA